MTKLTNKLIADLPIKSATYIVWDDEIKVWESALTIRDKKFHPEIPGCQGRRSIVRKPNIGVLA